MFGAFRPTSTNLGGLLWKTPWKLSVTRKANARARLKKVDSVIEAVRASGVQCESLNRALELPKEHEMPAKDKYTVFSATAKGYRKGIHKVPKWTRMTLRTNPKEFASNPALFHLRPTSRRGTVNRLLVIGTQFLDRSRSPRNTMEKQRGVLDHVSITAILPAQVSVLREACMVTTPKSTPAVDTAAYTRITDGFRGVLIWPPADASSARPAHGLSGFQIVKAIRSFTDTLGFVTTFKLYTDLECYDAPSPSFRSQVQCAGVTLVDTASQGRAGAASKMIIADTFVQCLDASPSNHSILVITADPDICYGVSLVRLRGYRTYILSPPNSHSSLSQFQPEGEFDESVLRDHSAPLSFNGEPPRVNGRARRPTVVVPPVKFQFNGETLAEPINILPTTSTIRGFNDFGAPKPPAASPGKPSAVSPGVLSIRSQSRTSSSSSSTESADAQVSRTPKAHVEEENDLDYVSITPPEDKSKAPNTNSYHDNTSISHPGTPAFNRRADFYVVPTTPSSPVSRNRFPLPDPKPTNGSVPFRASGTQSPSLPPPMGIEKVSSSASTVKAVGPSPLPQTVAALTQIKPQVLQVNPAIPDLKHPSPVKPNLPPFFPPPPLSPGRTKSVPPNHRLNLPISPPTSGSASSWGGTTSGKSTPFSFGGFAPPARSTPKPIQQTPISSFFSKPNINLPSSTTPKFVPPQVGGLKATAPTFTPASPAPGVLAPSTTALTAPPAPGPAPVASHFKPLVDAMKVFHTQSEGSIYRSDLGIHLKKKHPNLYAQAGFGDANKPFKRYMDAAAEAGIVLRDGNEYVSLASQYR